MLTTSYTAATFNNYPFESLLILKAKMVDVQFPSKSLWYMRPLGMTFSKDTWITLMLSHSHTRISHRKKLTKNLRYPRRSKLPPDFGINLFLKKPITGIDTSQYQDFNDDDLTTQEVDDNDEKEDNEQGNGDQESDIVWESDEIEAISSLFQGRIPQKPNKLNRERPLPLPVPHKLRPLGLSTPKKHVKRTLPRLASSRGSITNQFYKNPSFLIGLAKDIKSLDPDEDVSLVLDDHARFLRKGSLSLTIRELGHMGLPNRALQTFCWAQKQPQLYPDDRILGSTIEILARNNDLKVPFNLREFTSLASRCVIEAIARGFIRSGRLKLAWKLLLVAKDCKRMLNADIYIKLILEMGKNPDYKILVVDLLDELGEREDLNLKQQDCTAIMKICIRHSKFHVIESLFNWFKQSGHEPSVVLYTTMIHSRFSEKKYREALALVWEMENLNCLLDLPAYHVVIKLFVALNDLPRAVRYFSKLKEASFSPTYGIYRDMITMYLVSGRFAKCKEIRKEAVMAGFKLDEQLMSDLSAI